MEALFFLQKAVLKNRIKKALRKPVTYIFAVVGIFYIAMIFNSFHIMFEGMGMASARGLVGILTAVFFFITPANMIAYAKRKGLIYRPCDVHFIFSSPATPKQVLIYAHVKQILMTFVIAFLFMVGGCIWFQVSPFKMFLYFVAAGIVENIAEACLVILLYGNESIPEKYKKLFSLLMYTIIGSFLAIGIYAAITKGFNTDTMLGYLFLPAIQCIPFIGWNIAVIHFLFLGPTTVNVICSILYLLTVCVLFAAAKKMKCTGEYYEDAIKFADDYENLRNRNKKGEYARLGKKESYKKATITYKGNYAKAIFYRQMLEYRKSKFFIFGINSLVMLAVGIGIGVLHHFQPITKMKEFVIPGIMAYIIVVFSGYITKWGKELKSPYTYLIPDSSFHKLWYATLTEHIRSLADALLITIPGAIALRLSWIQVILTVAVYVCLQANKLYIRVLVEGILGNILGDVAKQMLQILLYTMVVGVSAVAAVIAGMLFTVESGFLVMVVVMGIMTLGCMFAAAGIFEKMDAVD